MEVLFFVFIITSLLLSLCTHTSHCQFPYVGNKAYDCSSTASTPKGYVCNVPKLLCQSFVTFRSTPPHNTPLSIAELLGSDSSDIASINRIQSTTEIIPTDSLVVVPVSCYCSGSIFLHYASYTVAQHDAYFTLANGTFQGLTTCQAIRDQNYYNPENIAIGATLLVPLKCACPSTNQMDNGITSLLTYIITWNDSTDSIATIFNVSGQSIREANILPEQDLIYPFTPIIVPLGSMICEKNPRSFFCYCPNGYVVGGTGSQESLKCIPDRKKFPYKLVLVIGACIGMGFLCLFLSSYRLYQYLKKRRKRIVKEKMFKQNGGLLLEQKFSSYGSNERAKLFSEEEMIRATDNYNESRFLGHGGFGMVYKGMLPDGSIVAIKKSKTIDRGQIEQFINEVVVLSQINHRNIVKLIGCCLETEYPLLVYEYIPNGTLSQHIHQQEKDCFLSWDDRFRIACEVARAIAYMHCAASVPIFHRDIKPSNILLDDKYTAKVSDFGTSKLIPNDKTHLTTAVRGTFGYMDPEYLQSSHFTDRSDVYSFGVVLVELLTSQKPTFISEDKEGRHLVAHFILLAKEGRVSDILDPVVASEAKTEAILAVAKLALRCLRLNGKRRPTMREVAMELEGLGISQSFSHTGHMPDLFEYGLLDEVYEADEQSIESDSPSFRLRMESELV